MFQPEDNNLIITHEKLLYTKHEIFHLQTLGPFVVAREMQRTRQAAVAAVKKSDVVHFIIMTARQQTRTDYSESKICP